MRSYYVYARDIDNTFISCNIAVATFAGMEADELMKLLLVAGTAKIKQLGYILPRHATLRFLVDPRNVEDAAGYPPDDVQLGGPDSYAVYSEYESGITPTH